MNKKIIVTLILALLPISAEAFLGEQKVQSQKASVMLSGVSNTVDQTYTTQDSTVDGIVVKEYINYQGKVFGVTWNGMHHPDLVALLGNYWPEYKELGQISARRKVKTVVQTDNIVVEKSGKMRDVSGRAYIKTLLPTGFNLNDLQ